MDMNKQNQDRILTLAISLLKNPQKSAGPNHIAQILDEICLIFPSSKALLDDPSLVQDGKDLFSFLKEMNPPALRRLLESEDSTKIALISFFFTRQEMAKMISSLDPSQIVEILIQIGRISKQPFQSFKHTAAAFSGHLKTRHATPKTPTPPPFSPKRATLPAPVPAPPNSTASTRKIFPPFSTSNRNEFTNDRSAGVDFEMVRILD